ncbi:hypothetical protein BLNAU_8227 [Blattamonas nauphoetae]|uniref:Uncharacterized protein n=1 Tax=Blattamonas nauphoetae TaxID=2049346 RepID=A0ABQ9XZ74_9EUKA|nr:hypothetical protein BLNAU_8227 [Blattamonas nauphoetae]
MNWDGNKLESEHEKAVIFQSLVATVKFHLTLAHRPSLLPHSTTHAVPHATHSPTLLLSSLPPPLTPPLSHTLAHPPQNLNQLPFCPSLRRKTPILLKTIEVRK